MRANPTISFHIRFELLAHPSLATLFAIANLWLACHAIGASATPEEIYSRVLGCFVGNSIGDAFGGPVEFAPAERVRQIGGKDWVDKFLPYGKDHKTHP